MERRRVIKGAVWATPVIAAAIAAPAAAASMPPQQAAQYRFRKTLTVEHNGTVTAHVQFERTDAGPQPAPVVLMITFGYDHTASEVYYLAAGEKSGELKFDHALSYADPKFPVVFHLSYDGGHEVRTETINLRA